MYKIWLYLSIAFVLENVHNIIYTMPHLFCSVL